MQTISPQELSDLLSQGKAELIDVRTPAEYREVHIDGARNVPLDRLQPDSLMAERNGQSDQPLYVTCKSGKRGSQACQKFIDAGFDRVVNVDGGVDAWESAKLPVVRGKKTISLER
jgi:rhodanese-related sulfurtransferase